MLVPVLVNFYVQDDLYEVAHEREIRLENSQVSVNGGASSLLGKRRMFFFLSIFVDFAVAASMEAVEHVAHSGEKPVTRTQACIFKVGDDVRQGIFICIVKFVFAGFPPF